MNVKLLVLQSCPALCDPIIAHHALLSTGFSRQEFLGGFPFPSPVGVLNPGIKPKSPALQADSLPSEPPEKLMLHQGSQTVKVFLSKGP